MISNALGFIPQNLPSLNLDFTQGILNAALSFSRNSIGTYFDSNGILQTAAVNAPRFDYDPATAIIRGLLIEEQRTNRFINSSNLATSTGHVYNEVTITAGATGLDGLNSACTIQGSNATISGIANSATFSYVTSSPYVATVYAKPGSVSGIQINCDSGPTVTFTLAGTGNYTVNNSANFLSASIAKLNFGFYRCTVVMSQKIASKNLWYFNVGIGSVIVAGIQEEDGSCPTSYIPTTSAAVSRSADICTLVGVSGRFNALQGTLYTEVLPISPDGEAGTLSDGGTSNRIQIGGSQQFYISPGPGIVGYTKFVPLTLYKMAGAYQSGNYAFASNGQILATSNNTTVPSGIDRLRIGSYNSSNSFFNGWIRKISYYPRRLSNSTLQALTL